MKVENVVSIPVTILSYKNMKNISNNQDFNGTISTVWHWNPFLKIPNKWFLTFCIKNSRSEEIYTPQVFHSVFGQLGYVVRGNFRLHVLPFDLNSTTIKTRRISSTFIPHDHIKILQDFYSLKQNSFDGIFPIYLVTLTIILKMGYNLFGFPC